MQRYFVQPDQIKNGQIEMNREEDVHHITRVMRFREGDLFICSNGRGNDFLVRLAAINKGSVMVSIKEELSESSELPVDITLAQALPKGDKMDWIVQKGAELGAERFIPFVAARTIVKLDEKKEMKRLERWQRIAKEAAEQSQRGRIPPIEKVISWKELMKHGERYDLSFIAFENEKDRTLYSVLKMRENIRTVLVLIGPEGGLTDDEAEEASQNGFIPVSLGKRILRTETAGLFVLSCLSFYFEGG